MRLLLLAALMFTGVAHAQTLRVALREDPDILDPTLARTYVGRIVFMGLCDKLFDINEKLEIVPQLATGYTWDSPTQLTLKLRDGVLFHDGEKFDAAAVKTTLERHLTLQGSFRRSEIDKIDTIEVVDPLTVRITLKEPNAPLLAQFADRAGMILSPKAIAASGKDFGLKPVCTGPMKFVERVAQDRIVLERFAQYWNAAAVKLDRVVYLPIPDSSVRLANLQAGGVDLVEYILPTDVAAVRANAKLRLVVSDNLGYEGITINIGNGPRAQTPLGQDSRVRRAFEASLDRQAISDVVYAGLYAPTVQALPSTSPFYVPDITPPGRDLAKAKALLKEAGVTLPVPITLTIPNNPDRRQVGEVIQAMAGEAGFDVKLNVMEFASSLAAETRGDFEAYLLNWSGRVDADGNFTQFMHTGASNNNQKYSNPEVDKLLDQARSVSDVAERRALYAKMWPLQRQDLPIVYLYSQKNLAGMTARVGGFRGVADGMIRLQGLTLAP